MLSFSAFSVASDAGPPGLSCQIGERVPGATKPSEPEGAWCKGGRRCPRGADRRELHGIREVLAEAGAVNVYPDILKCAGMNRATGRWADQGRQQSWVSTCLSQHRYHVSLEIVNLEVGDLVALVDDEPVGAGRAGKQVITHVRD